MNRILVPAAFFLLSSIPASAVAAQAIPSNMWVQQPPPTQSLPEGRAGVFAGRGWTRMQYDPIAGKMILFEGYAEPPVYVIESIYANALWFYDPVQNVLTLEKLNNWTKQNGLTEPLPENEWDPTPYDRHFFSCFIYSLSRNSVYLWAGANNTIVGNTIGNMWTYDFTTRAWREIPGPHPYTVHEQACSYDPNLETMTLFGGADHEYGDGWFTYHFDLGTETWTQATPNVLPSLRAGHSMCFDPLRRLTWMFFGAPWGSSGNEVWTYDAALTQWNQIPQQGPWPSPRRFSNVAYDEQHDFMLVWGGVTPSSTASDSSLNDTWLFRPSTQTWQQLSPAASPTGFLRYYSEDLEYDPEHDVFVLNVGGVFYLYRHAEATGAPVIQAPGVPTLRVSSPAMDAATLTISLPRAADLRLDLFDVSGRLVEQLARGSFEAGDHVLQWSARSAGRVRASGVYFARLTTPEASLTRKFVLVR